MVKFMFGFVLYLVVALVLTLSFVGFVRAEGSADLGRVVDRWNSEEAAARMHNRDVYRENIQLQQLEVAREQLETQKELLRELERDRVRDGRDCSVYSVLPQLRQYVFAVAYDA